MAAIKGRDTKIEVLLRSHLHTLGFRFRKNVGNLPGRPDIVFPSEKLVVFVDGDFWHGYQFSKWSYKLTPFWRDKIAGNIARDRTNYSQLKKEGWIVIRVWEHELKKDPFKCIFKVIDTIEWCRKMV